MKDIRKLLELLKPYRALVSLNILCNVLMAAFTVVSIPAIIPFFQILFNLEPKIANKPTLGLNATSVLDNIKYYFSQLIEVYEPRTALIYVCLIIIGLFFFKNLFRYLSLFVMAPVRNGVVRDLRNQLYHQLLKLRMGFYTEEKKGDLLSRMSSDISEIEFSILSMLEAFFREPIIIVGSIIFMIYVSPMLTLFVLGLILFTIVIIGGISRTLKKKSLVAQTQLGQLIARVEESINGLRIIKAFTAEHYQIQKFEQDNNAYKNTLNRILWRRDLSSPLSEFLGIVVVSVLMWYGSTQVFKEQVEPETFFAFLFAFYNVINPAKAFATAYYNLQKGLAAFERVEHILSQSQYIPEAVNPDILARFEQEINYKQVGFRYQPDGPNVLENIDLAIEKGKTIALVGSSGAGKSTLVDLIPRFYDVTEGQISIDGIPIQKYTLSSLRSLVGFVSQEPILFNDTILQNITFGTKDVILEDVIAASKLAYAHEFIEKMTDGYQTSIGDKGVKLSGGQKQRLTIARALYKNPPILILDEATSALDSESEKWVQKALHEAMKNRTVVVIAHRLSTIQNADEIIVLDQGKIIERGTHESLIKQNGEYLKFVELQSV